MLIYIAIFLSTLAADYAWTQYNIQVAKQRRHQAAGWSATIVAFGAFNVFSYTHNPWLVIPAVLGAYAGTWIAIWWDKRGQVEEYVQLFGEANMHWSKDPQVPYDSCGCRVCKPRTPCTHEGCQIEAGDSGVVRWSCGAIEG